LKNIGPLMQGVPSPPQIGRSSLTPKGVLEGEGNRRAGDIAALRIGNGKDGRERSKRLDHSGPVQRVFKMIEFQLSKDEIVRRMWRRLMLRPRIYLSLLFLFALGITVIVVAGSNWGWLPLGLSLMGPFNVWSLFNRSIEADPAWTDRVTLEFSEAGLSVSRATGKAEHNWNRFKYFSEDKDFFFLDTSKDYIGMLAPKRAFSLGEAERFRTCASRGIAGINGEAVQTG
jgi:hypothetical protein